MLGGGATMSIILPPCVKKAAASRDTEALDDIFSYLRSYADAETKEAVLWSIGYYDLINYNQRKLTANAQINSAPFFVCTPLEKPAHLAKYCTPEDEAKCPLKDPLTKFDMLIESVYLTYSVQDSVATLEINLRDGTKFVRKNAVYHPFNDAPFWDFSINKFLEWYIETHGREFPDYIVPKPGEFKKLLFKKLRTAVRDVGAPSMYQENVI